jgi:hypothetical protein
VHPQVSVVSERWSPKQSTSTWWAPPSSARQLARQVLDVDARAAVNVRRVLVREECDAHAGGSIASDDGAVGDLRVLQDHDDAVADVEAGPFTLLDPLVGS